MAEAEIPAWNPNGPEPFIPFLNWNKSTAAEFAIKLAEEVTGVTPIIPAGPLGVASVTM